MNLVFEIFGYVVENFKSFRMTSCLFRYRFRNVVGNRFESSTLEVWVKIEKDEMLGEETSVLENIFLSVFHHGEVNGHTFVVARILSQVVFATMTNSPFTGTAVTCLKRI